MPGGGGRRRACRQAFGNPAPTRYPHGLVELHYHDCALEDPAVEPSAGSGFAWVEADRLPGLPFPEANAPILRALADEFDTAG